MRRWYRAPGNGLQCCTAQQTNERKLAQVLAGRASMLGSRALCCREGAQAQGRCCPSKASQWRASADQQS